MLAVEPLDNLPSDLRNEFTYRRAALALAGSGFRGESWIACLNPYPDDSLREALLLRKKKEIKTT